MAKKSAATPKKGNPGREAPPKPAAPKPRAPAAIARAPEPAAAPPEAPSAPPEAPAGLQGRLGAAERMLASGDLAGAERAWTERSLDAPGSSPAWHGRGPVALRRGGHPRAGGG